jgi:hypothetical protein
MEPTCRNAARRELAFVLALATCGLAVVLLVAFAPWYDPLGAGGASVDVVHTYLPDVAQVAAARVS